MMQALFALFLMANAAECADLGASVQQIETSYALGELDEAKNRAAEALACPSATAADKVALHIQLAAIHDRIGLHLNTRPVPENLEHIEAAATLSDAVDARDQAKIMLARAKYHYRAEMEERQFLQAEEFAARALQKAEAANALYGQADAVHLLGLIFFQRRDMDKARQYFDRSLELEQQSGAPRPVMIGDYGRHVGFIHQRNKNSESAISSFRASLQARKEGGLDDAAMFAAITLASALSDAGRQDEAATEVQYALDVAAKIKSPHAAARAHMVEGKIYRAQGRNFDAKEAYEKAQAAALQIGMLGFARAAQTESRQIKF